MWEEEASKRLLGNIWEASGKHLGHIWEPSSRQLGCIWEASGRHLGRWRLMRHLGGIWRADLIKVAYLFAKTPKFP